MLRGIQGYISAAGGFRAGVIFIVRRFFVCIFFLIIMEIRIKFIVEGFIFKIVVKMEKEKVNDEKPDPERN